MSELKQISCQFEITAFLIVKKFDYRFTVHPASVSVSIAAVTDPDLATTSFRMRLESLVWWSSSKENAKLLDYRL